MADNDPYAQYYKPENDPYAAYGNQTPTQPAAPQSTLSQIGEGAKNLGIGALKGAGSTMSMADDFARKHLPAFMTNTGMGFGKPENIPAVHQMMQPQGTAQTIGKGIEQAGEFLIPGPAEAKVAEIGTHLGQAGEVGAKMLGAGVGSGLVNKAQGGSFQTGAELGAGGAALGAGIHAAAPAMAESAMKLPAKMRGFGRTPGRAILDETTGISPEAVGESAKNKIGELYGELEGKAADASKRDLSGTKITDQTGQPKQLFHGTRKSFDQFELGKGGGRGNIPADRQGIFFTGDPDAASAYAGEGETGANVRPAYLNAKNPYIVDMTKKPGFGLENVDVPAIKSAGHDSVILKGQNPRFDEYVALHPSQISAPWDTENNVASLLPARSHLAGALDRVPENAPTLRGQLEAMQGGLNYGSRGQIPANVTPSRLLSLKQGFSGEHLRWNPELHEQAQAAGRNAYHALDQELDRTVPGADQLNQRISSLIPAKVRGESLSRENPFIQRMGQRLGARTGALTLGAMGGAEGYREHGAPGAAAGFLAGAAAPELIADPTAQMAVARMLNHANTLRPAVGLAAQATQRGNQ